MEISKHFSDNACDVRFSGRFTFDAHQEFRDILRLFERPDIRQVNIDVSQVDFIDSAALGMLLLANDEASKSNRTLVIRGATGQVKKMFNLAQFNTIFTLT